MEFKDINELITKLELEFDTKDSTTPRKHCTGWKLNLVADKYYYVNCKLRDILTNEEELREAYYQVYLKLFAVYLKNLVKKNHGGLLLEAKYLCWAIDHKYDFFIKDSCRRESILGVVRYNNGTNYLTKKHSYYDDISREPAEIPDEVLKEALRIVHSILGKQFDKQVYKDKILLEQPTERGWQKLVLYCLEYFQEGELKDELYLECVLS